MARSLNFMLLLLLNQTFKKKTKVEKHNHKSFKKSHYYYFEGSQHLCQYQYEHKKTEPDDKL